MKCKKCVVFVVVFCVCFFVFMIVVFIAVPIYIVQDVKIMINLCYLLLIHHLELFFSEI